jgi:MFS family permease
MNLLSRGIGESYAVFLLPLARDFGTERATLTGVYSVYMLVAGMMSPLAGMAFDRLGPRFCYVFGLTLFGAAYLLAGSVAALWQLYVFIGIAGGIGAALIGMVPASGLANLWFRERLASAMGVLYAALGTGLLIIAPTTQWLIERLGWRGAYHALGALLLALLPAVLWLPWRHISAGPDAGAAATRFAGETAWTVARALRTPAFWALLGVMFFTSLTTYAIGVQAVAYLVETGFAPLEAASVYGLVGMISILGMLGSGVLAERFGERPVATLSYCSTIAGIGMLALLEWRPAYALVAAFVLLFGTMQGSRGPLVAVLAARNFAGGGLGTIYGTIMIGMGLGGAVGSWAAGTLHDLTGDYRSGFLLAAVSAGFGLAIFWTVRALSAAPRKPS